MSIKAAIHHLTHYKYDRPVTLGPQIIRGDYAPGFMVKLIQKDLGIVLDEARRLLLPLAGAALANQYFRSNQAHGEGDLGTQAMFRVLERLASLDT